MSIVLFVMFIVVGYLYLTEIFVPWHNRTKESVKTTDTSMQWNLPYLQTYTPGQSSTVVKITTRDIAGLSTVSLPIGTVTATSTVNIMAPVMLLSKQDDMRIYYPDNSVEYFSGLTKKWDKVQTSYRSVYEYATKMDCIIVENL